MSAFGRGWPQLESELRGILKGVKSLDEEVNINHSIRPTANGCCALKTISRLMGSLKGFSGSVVNTGSFGTYLPDD